LEKSGNFAPLPWQVARVSLHPKPCLQPTLYT